MHFSDLSGCLANKTLRQNFQISYDYEMFQMKLYNLTQLLVTY